MDIRELYQKYLSGQIEPEELTRFLDLVEQEETTVKALMEESWDDLERVERELDTLRSRARKRYITARKWVSAAAVLLLIAGGTWFYRDHIFHGHQPNSTSIAHTPDVKAPSSTKAVIVLSDGRQLAIDSLSNLSVVAQGAAAISKDASGNITYRNGASAPPAAQYAYNSIVNPRGSKVVSLVLSDGTRVWLNAETSLKYPVVFSGSTRQVEVTGEAYFEVKHDQLHPFRVKTRNAVIEDIGTAFNVFAYGNEHAIKTTLVAGAVAVAANASTALLKPGEQATVADAEHTIHVAEADVEASTAWKDNWFLFNKTDIETIMKQLARWYDVDIVYAGAIPQDHYTGKIPRDASLSEVLKVLELSQVHFSIDGKKITVL